MLFVSLCNQNMSNDKNKVEGLAPMNLPPAIVHYYITTSTTTLPWDKKKAPATAKKSREAARRSSHSAVEKRRRERMNDKIERLKSLIPSCNSVFPTSVQQPIHKLSVLQASIDYIGQLHHQLETRLPKDTPLLKDISLLREKKQALLKKEMTK